MLEYPEVMTIAAQIRKEAAGRAVTAVLPPSKEHKFCWFQGNPEEYGEKIIGSRIEAAEGFGIFVELSFDNGWMLCFNDGVNVRLADASKLPKTYQLVLILEDGAALVFSVAMYGGIILHDSLYEESYYVKSKEGISPLSETFHAHYRETLSAGRKNLSAKAFLATEQRFPGIGNGVLQDILFHARIHPKRKLETLSEEDTERLEASLVETIREMAAAGGRDTEKDLYGKVCGYPTKMSKKGLAQGCPVCRGEIVKETYLGGSVYYCPICQPLIQ